uniref:Uncharacterized protein n=1 Tax=Chromera velia CCMP2878 TaxID=1169474 RepID=A0A0G4GCD4_9ALVE|eukprot:Cvel_4483.t1-p1 / transcript=Cvel_4483.t1 / gene=Cvel_4483 / organism=Chromera_velia_CCMP2878 / gene_product=hypothetical protein / transcript_product=hypothetical protein / location=Cvel_scaffold196:42274-44307(-) / protein_length=290 / sequence_SO=supercontig / SO=protein_coding / is_pseudo=false
MRGLSMSTEIDENCREDGSSQQRVRPIPGRRRLEGPKSEVVSVYGRQLALYSWVKIVDVVAPDASGGLRTAERAARAIAIHFGWPDTSEHPEGLFCQMDRRVPVSDDRGYVLQGKYHHWKHANGAFIVPQACPKNGLGAVVVRFCPGSVQSLVASARFYVEPPQRPAAAAAASGHQQASACAAAAAAEKGPPGSDESLTRPPCDVRFPESLEMYERVQKQGEEAMKSVLESGTVNEGVHRGEEGAPARTEDQISFSSFWMARGGVRRIRWCTDQLIEPDALVLDTQFPGG